MNELITLTLHKDYLRLFSFLKDNPTKLERNGDYYRLTYWLRLGQIISPFRLGKLWLTVGAVSSDGWELIRDYQPTYAGDALLSEVYFLELEELRRQRQGVGLEFRGWLFDAVCYGIGTPEEVRYLVRLLFLTGYDMGQVIALYTATTKRQDLTSVFLEELNRFYKGVDS